MKYQTLKGFRDILPDEMQIRNEVISKTKTIVEKYGFLPLDTPTLEQADLLLGKYGAEEKLIYRFRDQGGRDIALRYDLTVSLARIIDNYKGQLSFPFKRYQIGKVFRAEKPQKGRFREFEQFDVDIVGSKEPISDAEIIAMISEWLSSFGLKFKIKINDRQILDKVIKKINAGQKEGRAILTEIDKLDKSGFENVKRELSKFKGSKELIDFIKIKDDDFEAVEKFIGDSKIVENIKKVKKLAEKLGAKNLVFAPRIARGLDYYTSTIFEAVVDKNEDIGSVAGGGRYDEMIGKTAGGDYPAVGTTFGIDRLIEVLKAQKKIDQTSENIQIAILNIDENFMEDYLDIAKKLREKNVACEIFYQTEKISKQLSKISKRKIPFALIYGSQEKDKNIFVLKNMQTGKQETSPDIKKIIKMLK